MHFGHHLSHNQRCRTRSDRTSHSVIKYAHCTYVIEKITYADGTRTVRLDGTVVSTQYDKSLRLEIFALRFCSSFLNSANVSQE